MLHHNASKFILKEQLVFWQQRDVVTNTHSLCCDQKLPLWLKCVKCSLCCRCWEIRVVWQTHTVFPRRSCYVVKVLCTMLVFDTLAWRYFTTAVSQLWWSTLCFSQLSALLLWTNEWRTERRGVCVNRKVASTKLPSSFSAEWDASPQAGKTVRILTSIRLTAVVSRMLLLFNMQNFRNDAVTKGPFERLKTHIWWSWVSLCVSGPDLVHTCLWTTSGPHMCRYCTSKYSVIQMWPKNHDIKG